MQGRIPFITGQTKDPQIPRRPHCSARPEKHPQNGEQILVVQKISLYRLARGSVDKQNQQAAFDGTKASLNRARQNTSSTAADSCRWFCPYKMKWNVFLSNKVDLKTKQKNTSTDFAMRTGATLWKRTCK